MKTFALLLAVCLVGVAVSKPAGSTRDELIDLLKGLLSKGQTTLVKKKQDAAGDAAAKPKPKGPLLKTTMFAGLGVDAFIKPHALTDEEVVWLLSVVTKKDLGMLNDTLEKVGKDCEDIANGFLKAFEKADIKDWSDLKPTLEKFYKEVVLPKELDMEGLKEWVDGLIVRAVISGTDDQLETGCIDTKSDKKDNRELACILGKLKFLEIAIEMRQKMTMIQLYDENLGEPLQFCDAVFNVAEQAHEDPTTLTPKAVVGALVDLGQCLINNAVKIESRLNPDAPTGKDGSMPAVPKLPLPSLIHLQSKMEQYEFQGWSAYMSFMVVEHLIGEGTGPPADAVPAAAGDTKVDKLRELLNEVRAKAKMQSRY